MTSLPHTYIANTFGTPDTHLVSTLENGLTLEVAAPANFGGPGDTWTPEEMLLGSLANCLVLTFKAIARSARLDWLEIHCQSKGELEKTDGGVKFTRVETRAHLVLPEGSDREKAEKLLEKTEHNCFISNTLNCHKQFNFDVAIQA